MITLNKRLRDAPKYAAAEGIFANHSPRVFPDVVTYTTLIRRSQNMRDMEKWLLRMKQSGVTPNAHTFNTILNRTETLAEAEKWLLRMEQSGVTPDDVTLSILKKLQNWNPRGLAST